VSCMSLKNRDLLVDSGAATLQQIPLGQGPVPGLFSNRCALEQLLVRGAPRRVGCL